MKADIFMSSFVILAPTSSFDIIERHTKPVASWSPLRL